MSASRFPLRPSRLAPGQRAFLLEAAHPEFTGSATLPAWDDAAWDSFIALADCHGIVPAVALVSETAAARALPDATRARLRRMRDDARLAATMQRLVLGETLAALGRRGIGVLLLKGEALAERAYRHPNARLSKDVDLLVAPADLEAAGEVLGKLGFEPVHATWYRERHFHEAWVHRSRQVAGRIELHWDVTRPGDPVRFGVASWFADARRFASRAGAVLLPPAAGELAFIAYHALADGAPRLRELADVFGLAHHESAPAREEALGAARVAGSSAHLEVAFALGAAFWGGLTRLSPNLGAARLPVAVAAAMFDPDRVAATGDQGWWALKALASWSLIPPDRRGSLSAAVAAVVREFEDSDAPAFTGPSALRPWRAAGALAVAACAALLLDAGRLPRRKGAARRGSAS